ncbi:hypothetical protein [Herpetosiphon geysericola]|uniref:hypothetical protein n=1 Tax=Herpetosiphon geysericola TaxID=70996 RepID=UPI0006C8EA2E|nr:hypothetical protein [Herpetosiphon geysericola]
MRRLIGVLAIGIIVLGAWPQASFAHNLCFEQTGFCLEEPFSDYWEANGGLPVFGYPLAAAADEVNRDTGQTYNTQWLERNRFEVHPENVGTPYEILLGLLGKTRLEQLGRIIEPAVEAKDGCLWFKETGHNVCDQAQGVGFKSYWQSHGLNINGLNAYERSLQLFGLPLTEAQTETNANGDTVITQWFERARFEWHPNNSAEFKVLLGLLGKEVSTYSAPEPNPSNTPIPTNTPTATPTALPITLTPTETPVPPPGKDSDGDGIPDNRDECPHHAGVPSRNGCPYTPTSLPTPEPTSSPRPTPAPLPKPLVLNP